MDSKTYHRTWYFTRTLLSCDPDINKRGLYRGSDLMHRFNDEMKPWSEWKDEALQRACDELNKIEEACEAGR